MPNREFERCLCVCKKNLPKLSFSVLVTHFSSNYCKLVYLSYFCKETCLENNQNIKAIFNFSSIHMHTIQNAKNCNHRKPATFTGKDKAPLAFPKRM